VGVVLAVLMSLFLFYLRVGWLQEKRVHTEVSPLRIDLISVWRPDGDLYHADVFKWLWLVNAPM